MKNTIKIIMAVIMSTLIFSACSNIEGNEPTQKIADYDKSIITESFNDTDAQIIISVCDYLYSIKENKIPDIQKIYNDTNALEIKDMSSSKKVYVLVYENGINLIITDSSNTVTFVKNDRTAVMDIGFCLIESPAPTAQEAAA